jgi:ABC-type phosphate/phosphonate transport system substrate-binding protein
MARRRLILASVGILLTVTILVAAVVVVSARHRTGPQAVLGIVPPTPAVANLAKTIAPVAQALGGQLNCQVVPRVYPSYGHLITALGKGECDMAVLPPFEYAYASANYGAQVVLAGTHGGTNAPEMEILARAGSPVTVPAQLSGARIAVSAAQGTLIHTYAQSFLGRFGLTEAQNTRLIEAIDDQAALSALLAGSVEAVAVDRGFRDGLRAAQPTLDSQVQVVWIAEPIAYEAVVLSPYSRVAPADARRAWQAVEQQLDTNGTPVFASTLDTLFGFDGLVQASDADYAAASAAVATLGLKFR